MATLLHTSTHPWKVFIVLHTEASGYYWFRITVNVFRKLNWYFQVKKTSSNFLSENESDHFGRLTQIRIGNEENCEDKKSQKKCKTLKNKNNGKGCKKKGIQKNCPKTCGLCNDGNFFSISHNWILQWILKRISMVGQPSVLFYLAFVFTLHC